MVDTARSVAALKVLLADNETGDISPQDIRDLLVSLVPSHGELAITTAIETTINTVDVWEQVDGVWTLTAATSDEFEEAGNGQLRYTGTPTRIGLVTACLTATAAGNNKYTEWAIAKNGTVIPTSQIARFVATGADSGAVAVQALTSLSTNDYVSVFVKNETDDVNLTAAYGSLIVWAHIQ